jgi:hypothetical protein
MSTRNFTVARVDGLTIVPAAVPARGASRPEIHYLSGTSDLAASEFVVRRGVSEHTVTADAAAPGTTLVLNDVTGLASGQQIVLQPRTGAAAAIGTIATVTAGTKTITLTGVNLAMAAGSKVYRMQDLAELPCGATTKEYKSEGDRPILVGRNGMPMTVVLNGTSACAINAITGSYVD